MNSANSACEDDGSNTTGQSMVKTKIGCKGRVNEDFNWRIKPDGGRKQKNFSL